MPQLCVFVFLCFLHSCPRFLHTAVFKEPPLLWLESLKCEASLSVTSLLVKCQILAPGNHSVCAVCIWCLCPSVRACVCVHVWAERLFDVSQIQTQAGFSHMCVGRIQMALQDCINVTLIMRQHGCSAGSRAVPSAFSWREQETREAEETSQTKEESLQVLHTPNTTRA